MSAPARKLADGVAVVDAPKILVIEDDESTRFLLGLTLAQQREFDLIWATCVAEGKHCFIQNQVDLIVCDQNMGDGFGTDVLRFVRERDIEIPFILFTAQFRDDLPELESFKCCYVQKPAITTLLAEITHHLGGRHGKR